MLAKILFVTVAVMVFAITVAFAADDYTLVYDQVGMDGGYSDTGDYQVVDMLFSTGVEGGAQDSTDYSVTPTTGDTSSGTSSVECWMLYSF